MRLLAQVVKAAVGQLRSFGGNLHREARGDAGGALLVDQGESLEVSWRKHRGDLQVHRRKRDYPTLPERSGVKTSSRAPPLIRGTSSLICLEREMPNWSRYLRVPPTRSL